MSDSELFLVRNVTRDRTVAARVEWAGCSETRKRGLLGRDSLPPDEGMYIVPCQWIHMFGMKFPIDVAFLSSSGRVLALHRSLRPWRLSRPVLRAEGVLELSAGALDRSGTAVGDVLELLPA
ncbi:MAG TPA: DUF192 domain-containing protein [bacterium]|nr:DUF192 domain-containing protein [bacterium]